MTRSSPSHMGRVAHSPQRGHGFGCWSRQATAANPPRSGAGSHRRCNPAGHRLGQALIRVLQDAPLGKKIRIYLRANPSGNGVQLQALIEALARTNADVEIAVGRFAMSCAATLWLWYALDPVNPDNARMKVVLCRSIR